MSEDGDTDGDESDEPFGNLLEEIDRRRREGRADLFDPLDDAGGDGPRTGEGVIETGTSVEEIFTEESFDELETDDLWDEIAGRTSSTDGTDDRAGGDPTVVDGTEMHVVPKRAFCETCPHLTEPPDFRCTHDGTEIVEFVDTEHVRVRNCPIVEERRDRER